VAKMAKPLVESGKIKEDVLDLHRAIDSLVEELEAIDFYNQRASETKDKELKAILVFNRDDEKEHASLLIEYIRKHDSKFGEMMKKFLFKKS
jgi:hypothetical protein